MNAFTIRLLGVALLTAAGALAGYGRTAALNRRLALLREVSDGLGRMADELTVLRSPLPVIFERLRDLPFFRLLNAGFGLEPTDALWRRAAETLELDRGSRQALSSLGTVVGRYDAERQAAELSLVRARLDEQARAMETELNGRAKNFTGLGAALGAILAVVLF